MIGINPSEFTKTIPDFAMRRIHKIMEKTGMQLEEVIEEYYDIFMSDFVQNDPQFRDDNDRHDYASRVLLSRCQGRAPVKKFEIIPIGYSRVRRTRNGDMLRLYAIVKGKGIVPIICRDKFIDLPENITLFAKYTVRLGELSDGTLITDMRTKFKEPEPLNVEPSVLFEKMNIPRITIAEAEKNPSRQRSDGFVDDTDWRVIRGIISRQFTGTDKNGIEYGRYVIMDDTSLEERVLPDGRTLPPGLTVWISPSLMKWGTESECDFYGTIEIDQNGIPFMNCFMIIPIHAIPL